MKKLLLSSLALVFGVSLLFVATHKASAQTASSRCVVETIGTQNGAGGPHSKFTIQGNRAYIKYKISGDRNCNPTVSLKSWYSPSRNGEPHAAQVLFQEVQRTPGLGNHQMSVDLPANGCFYQVDFVRIIPNRQPGQKNEMLGFVLDGNKNCIPKPPVPTYSCTALGVSAAANRTAKITSLSTVAKNATYKRAVIAWGDGTYSRANGNPAGTSHQYTQDGTYTITATAFFTTSEGKEVAAPASAGCSRSVKFTTSQPPVVEPPTVTPPTTTVTTASTEIVTAAVAKELPNTGPGAAAAIFGSVTTLATAGHAFITRRRLF